jgi:hypothetical protein
VKQVARYFAGQSKVKQSDGSAPGARGHASGGHARVCSARRAGLPARAGIGEAPRDLLVVVCSAPAHYALSWHALSTATALPALRSASAALTLVDISIKVQFKASCLDCH